MSNQTRTEFEQHQVNLSLEYLRDNKAEALAVINKLLINYRTRDRSEMTGEELELYEAVMININDVVRYA